MSTFNIFVKRLGNLKLKVRGIQFVFLLASLHPSYCHGSTELDARHLIAKAFSSLIKYQRAYFDFEDKLIELRGRLSSELQMQFDSRLADVKYINLKFTILGERSSEGIFVNSHLEDSFLSFGVLIHEFSHDVRWLQYDHTYMTGYGALNDEKMASSDEYDFVRKAFTRDSLQALASAEKINGASAFYRFLAVFDSPSDPQERLQTEEYLAFKEMRKILSWSKEKYITDHLTAESYDHITFSEKIATYDRRRQVIDKTVQVGLAASTCATILGYYFSH